MDDSKNSITPRGPSIAIRGCHPCKTAKIIIWALAFGQMSRFREKHQTMEIFSHLENKSINSIYRTTQSKFPGNANCFILFANPLSGDPCTFIAFELRRFGDDSSFSSTTNKGWLASSASHIPFFCCLQVDLLGRRTLFFSFPFSLNI
jgi:hypothetical protein